MNFGQGRAPDPRRASPGEREGEACALRDSQAGIASFGCGDAHGDSTRQPLPSTERQRHFCDRIASILLTAPDDDVYVRVLDIAREATASSCGAFSYLDEDGTAVATTLTRAEGTDDPAAYTTSRHPRDTWGDQLWARAILRQQSLYANSTGNVSGGYLQAQRALVVPILFRGAVIGHFALAGKPTDYREEDVTVVECIAACVAPIWHARLAQERLVARLRRAETELAALSWLPAQNPRPVLRIGADGVIQYTNAACAPLLAVWKREPGEVVPDEWREWIAGALAARENREIEITTGGRDFTYLLTPARGGDYANIYGHDVTDRRLAEKRRRHSEALLAQAERIARVGAWEWNRSQDAVTLSKECARLLGTRDRLTRAEVAAVVHPEDLPALRQAFAEAWTGSRTCEIEFRVLRPDTGAQRFAHLRGEIDCDPSGEPLRLHGSVQDITEHKRAEAALRESEERFRATFEQAAVGIAHVKPDGQFLRVNQRFADIVGYTPEELRQRTIQQLTSPEDLPAEIAAVHQLLAGDVVTVSLEKRYVRKNGALVWVSLTLSAVRDAHGECEYVIGVVQDTTARKRAELGLAQRTRELETLANNAPDIIVRVNRQLQYVFVNRRWSELMGVPPDAALGKTSRELGLPDAICQNAEEMYPAVFADRQMRAVELRVATAEGVRALQLRMVPELGDEGGEPQTILNIARDVTEQSRLQDELIQAQKLEVVGRLAAGIAHDVNNVLLAVSGYAALARRELGAGHPALESLAALERTVSEAGAIPKGLLTFTHRAPADRAPVDLRAVLFDAERLLKRLLPASIELRCEPPGSQPLWILGDATQMRQVILNLAINARDAMPEGGRLRIGLEAIAGEPGQECGQRERAARFTISDSGTGIAADILPRVFEPFFTTKPRGSGTGLGLPIVKSIVEAHGGRIELCSTPGAGTTVVIHLPCIRPPRAPRATEARPAEARGRGEWILVADDNAQVLEVLAAGLRQMGYEPQQATDSPSALAQFAQHANRIRLLILDYDLPGGSGLNVLRTVRRTMPALPALLISGELDRDLGDARDDRTRVIRKPFRLDDLMELVTELLTQGGETEVPPES